jgi:hypothetical protein
MPNCFHTIVSLTVFSVDAVALISSALWGVGLYLCPLEAESGPVFTPLQYGNKN